MTCVSQLMQLQLVIPTALHSQGGTRQVPEVPYRTTPSLPSEISNRPPHFPCPEQLYRGCDANPMFRPLPVAFSWYSLGPWHRRA